MISKVANSIILLSISIMGLLHFVSSLGHGEHCEADCDERLGLVCTRDSICECMNTNATLFDTKQGRCVSRAGFPCSRIRNETLCVANAYCENVNSPCVCKKNYFQTRNGTCSLMAKYGDNCSSRKLCDVTNGIECVGKTCQCKFPDQLYSRELKACVGQAGGNCSFDLTCTPNSDCSQDIFELRQGLNIHGRVYHYNATIGRTCACLEGFTQTSDRKCKATRHRFCNSTVLCNEEENLRCIDNVCQCKHPLHEEYTEESKKCLGLVSVLCAGGNSDCHTNSECIEGRCQCKLGYSVTPQRNCLKDIHVQCSASECNVFNALGCHNGVCECLDEFLVYDKAKKACVASQSGNFCGALSVQQFTNDSRLTEVNIFVGCQDHLRCEKIHTIDSIKSVCV